MNSALFFLTTRTVWNTVLAKLRRLRQPKYLFGVVVGAVYLYWIITGPMRGGRGVRRPRGIPENLQIPAADLELLISFAAFMLLLVVVLIAWILPSSRAALTFTEAELAFLLPGPVSRQTLVRYKLLKSQMQLLLLALVITLISGRMARDGLALVHAAGWWIVLSTVQMHRLGASFALSRLYDRGLSNGRRRLLALAVLLGLAGLVVAWNMAAPAVPKVIDKQFFQSGLFQFVREFLNSGPAPWILLPFRWVVAPYFAPNAGAFALAALPALGLLVVHYFWVTRADVAFEEASIVQSREVAERAAALKGDRSRGRVPPTTARRAIFALSPAGAPWIGLFWKSLLQWGGRRTFNIVGSALAGLLLLAAILMRTSARPTVIGFLLVGAILGLFGTVIFLPLVTGRGLQIEMTTGDAAKVWPIAGWQLVLGHLLGPVLIGALVQVVCLAVLASLMAGQTLVRNEFWMLPLCALPLLPFLNLVLSFVPSTAPLLFPGWFRPGEQAGIETTGIRIISFLGQVLFSALALAPVVLAAGAVFLAATWWVTTLVAGLLALITAAVLLALEALGGIVLLGGIVERFDPTEV